MSDILPNIVVTLPMCPSANRLWRHIPGRRRPIISPEYARWLTAAGWEAKRQLVGVPQILGQFTARIEVPATSRKDLGNHEKPCMDLLERIGAIRDDKGCQKFDIAFSDRYDILVALFDIGGPVFKRQRGVRPVGWQSTRKPTAKQIAKARRVGVLA